MAKKENSQFTRYIQLTGIAFEMMAIMFVFIWLGKKSDQKWGAEDSSLFTLFGTLLGLGVSLYVILKQLNRLNEK
ncbi:MAG: AtpZ/AtpI family protein [Moheibacter sp.]